MQRLLGQIKLFQRRQHRELADPEGLSRTGARVLGAISHHDGLARPSLIAERTEIASPNVAAALRELEGRGLIERTRSEDDSRRVNLRLTPAGADFAQRSRAARAAWVTEAVEAVLTNEEQRTLIAAGHLLERVAAWGGTASPVDAAEARA